MNIKPVSAKIVLGVCTVLLVFFFALSRDVNKFRYQQNSEWLAQLAIASLELDDEILRLRGGYSKNYDALAQAARLFEEKASSADVYTHRRYNMRVDQFFEQLGLVDGPVAIDRTILQRMKSDRLEIIDRFKSDFAIVSTAKSAALLFLEQLEEVVGDESQWGEALRELQMALIALDGTAHDGTVIRLWKELDSGLANVLSSQQKSAFSLLDIHIENVGRYSPKVNQLVMSEMHIADKLGEEIVLLQNKLDVDYANAEMLTNRYRLAFIVVVGFVLVYGGYQARRSVNYAHKIEDANKNLELEIARRTQDLQGALARIHSETEKKQSMIEAMQIKDREMANSEAFFRAITQNANNQIVLIDELGAVSYANPRAVNSFGVNPDGRDGSTISKIFPQVASVDQLIALAGQDITAVDTEGNTLSMKCSVNQFKTKNFENSYAIIMHDFTDMKLLEEELAQAHKLESVGQLAAGIAHEINTPAQFISDNLFFLKDAVAEIFELFEEIENQCKEAGENEGLQDIAKKIEEVDVEYLAEEVPSALSQSSDGIQRVTTIVRAMKDYAHPGESFGQADLNQAIEGAIIVCRNEWKYTAELETEFDPDLPMVECVVSDINQVVLNMVVNAAHAIADHKSDNSESKGEIRVSTQSSDDSIIIKISDNGSGMSEEVRSKIFDQFFTTKEVGKGTGQGLSIAYKLVVEKHSGKIDVESTVGEGTTFNITLPIVQPSTGNEESTMVEERVA